MWCMKLSLTAQRRNAWEKAAIECVVSLYYSLLLSACCSLLAATQRHGIEVELRARSYCVRPGQEMHCFQASPVLTGMALSRIMKPLRIVRMVHRLIVTVVAISSEGQALAIV